MNILLVSGKPWIYFWCTVSHGYYWCLVSHEYITGVWLAMNILLVCGKPWVYYWQAMNILLVSGTPWIYYWCLVSPKYITGVWYAMHFVSYFDEPRMMSCGYRCLPHRLSPRLYKRCAKNARDMCHADDWRNKGHQESDDTQGDSFVFSCLYRHMKQSHPEKEVSRCMCVCMCMCVCVFAFWCMVTQQALPRTLSPQIKWRVVVTIYGNAFLDKHYLEW